MGVGKRMFEAFFFFLPLPQQNISGESKKTRVPSLSRKWRQANRSRVVQFLKIVSKRFINLVLLFCLHAKINARADLNEKYSSK